MSKNNPQIIAAVMRSWALPAAGVGVVVAAMWSYDRTGEVHAAAGSPYYDKAVKEAIAGLVNTGAAPAPAGRPPLPAGLSPDDYYWCDQHQTYHKRETPAAGQGQAAAANPAAATPPNVHPAPALPPLVAGKPPLDYYWCDECLAFHLRPDRVAQPAVAAQPPPAAAAPGTQPAQGAEAIPPLPAGLNPADYYWCPNCKTYHPRQQATPGQPATPPTPSPANPPTPPPANPPPATPPAGTSKC